MDNKYNQNDEKVRENYLYKIPDSFMKLDRIPIKLLKKMWQIRKMSGLTFMKN